MPKSLNDLQLVRIIGKGAFAVVYLAKEICTNHLCAVKCVTKNKQTKSESYYMNKLKNSPNIINCLWKSEGKLTEYIVLEFMNFDLYKVTFV